MNSAAPRVALFLPTLNVGGAEKVMATLANGLCERGYAVDLVLASARGPYLDTLLAGVTVVDLGATRVLFALPALVRYLRRARPAALMSALDHCNVVALAARLLARVPLRVVITIHSNFTHNVANDRSLKTWLSTYWVRPFYPRADAIVAVSGGVADDLCRTLGLARDRVCVIHNPVVGPDLAAKAAAPLDHPWFAPGQPPVVVGVGRLTEAKNFASLIRACALLGARRPLRLLLVGDGPEQAALARLAAGLGMQDNVGFAGYVANPYPYMRQGALFVLSSRWEGFGNVLAEALACGARVVSTDCPSGPGEILEGGRWGELVAPDDDAALARAMERALDAGALAGAAEAASARFGVAAIVSRYEQQLFPLSEAL